MEFSRQSGRRGAAIVSQRRDKDKPKLCLEQRSSGRLRHPRAVELGKVSPGRLLAPIRLRIRPTVCAEQAPKIGLPKEINLGIAAANERDRVNDGAEQIGAPGRLA